MPNYKVVDAEQLDAAMTATADAIRAKTGETATIPWNAETGFAEVVTSITGGDTSNEDGIIARNITEYTNDRVTYVGKYVFYQSTKLTTVDLPAVTKVNDYAFDGCTSLTTVNIPKVTSIGAYTFRQSTKLTTADFPAAKSVGGYAFSECTSLTTVNIPKVTSIETDVFYKCTSLTTADFPAATYVGSYAFSGCSSLVALILRAAQTISMGNKNAIASTPIASGTGYIYVPAALVDSYKAKANWITYANQFRALEDYTVDGTTTGALDPDKI